MKNFLPNYKFNGFGPIIDKDFFPQPIDELIKKAPAKNTIYGFTSDEMGFYMTPTETKDEGWVLDKNTFSFDKLHDAIGVMFPEDKYRQFAMLIQHLALYHYVDYGDGDRNNKTFLVQKMKELQSDRVIGAPILREAALKQKYNSSVWLYFFDYYDNGQFVPSFPYKGAQHGSELLYLFKNGINVTWNDNNKKIRDLMTTSFSHFATFGHPDAHESIAFSWDPIDENNPTQCLQIGVDSKMRGSFSNRRVSFWSELQKIKDSNPASIVR